MEDLPVKEPRCCARLSELGVERVGWPLGGTCGLAEGPASTVQSSSVGPGDARWQTGVMGHKYDLTGWEIRTKSFVGH